MATFLHTFCPRYFLGSPFAQLCCKFAGFGLQNGTPRGDFILDREPWGLLVEPWAFEVRFGTASGVIFGAFGLPRASKGEPGDSPRRPKGSLGAPKDTPNHPEVTPQRSPCSITRGVWCYCVSPKFGETDHMPGPLAPGEHFLEIPLGSLPHLFPPFSARPNTNRGNQLGHEGSHAGLFPLGVRGNKPSIDDICFPCYSEGGFMN